MTFLRTFHLTEQLVLQETVLLVGPAPLPVGGQPAASCAVRVTRLAAAEPQRAGLGVRRQAAVALRRAHGGAARLLQEPVQPVVRAEDGHDCLTPLQSCVCDSLWILGSNLVSRQCLRQIVFPFIAQMLVDCSPASTAFTVRESEKWFSYLLWDCSYEYDYYRKKLSHFVIVAIDSLRIDLCFISYVGSMHPSCVLLQFKWLHYIYLLLYAVISTYSSVTVKK